MKVSRLSTPDVNRIATKSLGLDEDVVDLLSPEGLCASLRRAASFLCPATPRQIVESVLEAVSPIAPSGTPSRDDLLDQLDLLISVGDLLEMRYQSERATRLLYLGPPSYVAKGGGRYLLLGVRPFGAALVGSSLASEVRYEGHTRTVEFGAGSASERLATFDLHEIRREQWTKRPAAVPSGQLLDEYRQRLGTVGPSGQVDGLTLIDQFRDVRYYRGRWRDPRAGDTGEFVARRPQAYGADLWCFARLVNGDVQRFVDLPTADESAPGRDEAWRLQAALDAERGNPQVVRTRRAPGGAEDDIVDFFSPVPSWAERYLGLVGLSVLRSKGSLFSYRVPTAAMVDLAAFLADMLWIRALHDGEKG